MTPLLLEKGILGRFPHEYTQYFQVSSLTKSSILTFFRCVPGNNTPFPWICYPIVLADLQRAGCAQPPFDRTVGSRSLPAPITANHTTPCARSFTSRPARPATRLELSSGRYDARFRSASGSLSAELRTTNLRTKRPSGPLPLADHLGGARD